MSDYTQVNDYSAKDALSSGDPNKKILGSDIDAELAAIATAIATKADDSGVVHTSGTETVAGDKTLSGNNTHSGNNTASGIWTHSKTVKWAKGADVASANPLVLGTDGNYFDITGTTGFASISTVGAGTVVKLHFDDALTITHHATDLILPGGANITTAAGDEAEFVEYASGDWRCTNYTRASKTNALTDLLSAFATTNGTWSTFTPTVTLDGAGTVPQFTTNTGYYSQVGKIVFVWVYLTGDGGNEGAGAGQLQVALPVAASANHALHAMPVGALTNSSASYVTFGTIAASASVMKLFYINGSSPIANLTGAETADTTRAISLHFFYHVD